MTVLPPLAAMGAALAGNAILSLGMVLQKRHIGWMDARKAGVAGGGYRRDVLFWGFGFALMNIQPVFVFFALAGLPANVVAAAAGSSVAFTALLSAPLLGERLEARKAAWTLALFLAIAAAGLTGKPGDGMLRPLALYAAFILPAVAVAAFLAVRRGTKKESGAAVIAAAAGCLAGFMVLALQALRSDATATAAGWLGSPYLYLYLGGGIGSFVLNQIAYRSGPMSMVAPAFYGMQVLWPALASYAVFGAGFDLVQAVAFIGIAASVRFMAAGAPGR